MSQGQTPTQSSRRSARRISAGSSSTRLWAWMRRPAVPAEGLPRGAKQGAEIGDQTAQAVLVHIHHMARVIIAHRDARGVDPIAGDGVFGREEGRCEVEESIRHQNA